MKKEINEGKKEVNNYLKYSGIGFQIAGITGVGAFIGYKLDQYFKTNNVYFTLGFCVVFMAAAFFIAFRGLMKNE